MTILSHYTSRAGLEGIAKTGALWATNFLTVNDTSEFFYAWRKIQRAAFVYALDRMPDDLKSADFDIEQAVDGCVTEFRAQMTSGSGFGHLFITSFALAKTPEEERRGILTLWDRYTKLEGYCLQFDRSDIERMVRLDAAKSSYQWLELVAVRYGVETETHSFRELARQMGEQQLLQVSKETRDRRIEIDHRNHWAPSHLVRQLASFCGTHKDPAFDDEREFRIVAYPHDAPDVQFLSGLAAPKEILDGPPGRKHIVIGDNWTPGIEPVKIIIGPKANRDIDAIVRRYRNRPAVEVCDIPVR